MARSASPGKDLVKKEEIDLEIEYNDQNYPSGPSCIDKVAMNEQLKISSPSTDEMPQTIGMFRKYLLPKAQNIRGKTNTEESQVVKTRTLRPLLPPKFGSNMPRHASLLEQELLPGIRSHVMQPPSDGESRGAQLTIFYSGSISVYDNVSIDKAQAIMLLAGESSLSKPVAIELPKTDTKKTLQRSKSIGKLQPDIPIARKISLQHFLEKRRYRLTTRAPYPPSNKINEDNESTTDGGSNVKDNNLSLSPFPSRLGYFCSVSANKKR